jgi:hypothetical protein
MNDQRLSNKISSNRIRAFDTDEMKITVVSRSGKKIAVLDGLKPTSTIADVQKELHVASKFSYKE